MVTEVQAKSEPEQETVLIAYRDLWYGVRWSLYWQEKVDKRTGKRFFVTDECRTQTWWISRKSAEAWRAFGTAVSVKSHRFPQGFVEPEWVAVWLDETEYYAIDPEDRPFIERIIGVYFYDSRSYSYMCEITPSYVLEPIYASVWCTSETPDDVRDRLDGKYAHEEQNEVCMHVRDVERIAADRKQPFGRIVDDVEDEGEVVREYWQGNCPF